MRLKKIAALVVVALGSAARAMGLAPGALALKVTKEDHAKLPKEVQALYVESGGEYALELPEGVEEVAGLKTALDKERKAARDAAKALKDFQTRFEGIDPDEWKRLMEKLGGDEEATLLKAGKIDEVVARRTDKVIKDAEKRVKEAADAAAKVAQQNERLRQRAVDDAVRQAAGKAGMHVNAVDDALFRARTIFTYDPENDAVVQLKENDVVMGKDGKTPFGPGEWLETMKEGAPHWFPAGSGGGGGRGDGGGARGAKTMKRAEFDKLDPVAQRRTIMEDKIQVVD